MKRFGVLARIFIFACIIAMLLSVTACGKNYVCDNCGNNFSGEAFYGMGGDEIMCKDCARSYWLPFDFEDYKWK